MLVPTKPKIGRPSDYDPKYINILRQLRQEGKSVAAFCSTLGISNKTYYNWREKYPDFDYACDVAEEDSKAYLGNNILDMGTGKKKDGNVAALKDVYDRQHGSVKSQDESKKTEINIGNMNVLQGLTDEQLQQRFVQLARKNANLLEGIVIQDGSDIPRTDGT